MLHRRRSDNDSAGDIETRIQTLRATAASTNCGTYQLVSSLNFEPAATDNAIPNAAVTAAIALRVCPSSHAFSAVRGHNAVIAVTTQSHPHDPLVMSGPTSAQPTEQRREPLQHALTQLTAVVNYIDQ